MTTEPHVGKDRRGKSGVRADYPEEVAEAAIEFLEAVQHHLSVIHEESHALLLLMKTYRRRDPTARGKVTLIRPE